MHHVIKINVFRAKVILLVGDYEDIKNKVPYWVDCFSDSGYMARCAYSLESGKHPHVVVIHSRSAAISVIAHESVHAASYIYEGMGMEACYKNDEIVAYLVQYICEEAERKLNVYGVGESQ